MTLRTPAVNARAYGAFQHTQTGSFACGIAFGQLGPLGQRCNLRAAKGKFWAGINRDLHVRDLAGRVHRRNRCRLTAIYRYIDVTAEIAVVIEHGEQALVVGLCRAQNFSAGGWVFFLQRLLDQQRSTAHFFGEVIIGDPLQRDFGTLRSRCHHPRRSGNNSNALRFL